MKNLKNFLLFLFTIATTTFSQHLPLGIGNEWDYGTGNPPSVDPYIATATDTVHINNKLYYKIERFDVNTKKVTKIIYDRMEGDSIYYRLGGDIEKLIFNFNLKEGQIISQPNYDDTTFCTVKLIGLERIDTLNVWGISTIIYMSINGFYCPKENPDTIWSLTPITYLKYFGCWNTSEGNLVGARINGIEYGTLYPLPVELISFSKKIFGNSIQLDWSTATESNNYGFEILRSSFPDSNTSFKIGFVKGSGSTTEIKDYKFIDNNLKEGDYKYRLVQVDYNGTRTKIAETTANIWNPNNYILYQNYPNPFNPTTNIEFNVCEESDVTLLVYNSIAEIVYRLNKHVKPGKNEITFDGKNLSSGIYYYQIRSNNFIDTKKMLLLK